MITVPEDLTETWGPCVFGYFFPELFSLPLHVAGPSVLPS